jgi:hypothetical protein
MKNVLLFCFAMLVANLSSALDLYSCGDDILNEQQAKEKSCSFLVSNAETSANWIFLAASSKMHCYKHEATRRGAKGVRIIWALCIFDKPQRRSSGAEYLSTKSLYHFDCRNKQMATQRIVFYSGRLGNGESINRDIEIDIKELKFEDAIPGSVGEDILSGGCK